MSLCKSNSNVATTMCKKLSDGQQDAFDKYKKRCNVFITGPGGSGKSELIRHIYNDANLAKKKIQVCAMTGCASILLGCGAKTIHSWAGIGICDGDIETLTCKINGNFFLKKLWRAIDVLIVDEVSMMSQKIFDVLNSIGKCVRECPHREFGGIQLLFFGDFYQLPPISLSGLNEDVSTIESTAALFCFESPDWFKTFDKSNHVCLTHIFRQTEILYQTILNQIRVGEIDKSSETVMMNKVKNATTVDKKDIYTKIVPTRKSADSINSRSIMLLTGVEHTFTLSYDKKPDDKKPDDKKPDDKKTQTPVQIEYELKRMRSSIICDDTIKLKIGANVMCIVNINSELANNTLLLCNGSQGIVDRFDAQGYPVVKFNNGVIRSMMPHSWQSDNIKGIGITQVPLILSWAITIHKSQGSTLDNVDVDVGSEIFEYGQTYVALSRVRSLDGLILSSFDYKKIKVHKKVKEFYNFIKTQVVP